MKSTEDVLVVFTIVRVAGATVLASITRPETPNPLWIRSFEQKVVDVTSAAFASQILLVKPASGHYPTGELRHGEE
jgi:hypothetical protein